MVADRKEPEEPVTPTAKQVARVRAFLTGRLEADEREDVVRLIVESPEVLGACLAELGRERSAAPDRLTTDEVLLISRLIDGVLDDEEQAAARALLAKKPDAYDVFVESAAMIGGTGQPPFDGEQQKNEGRTVPPPPVLPWWRQLVQVGKELAKGMSSAPWKVALPLAATAALTMLILVRPGPGMVLTDLGDRVGTEALEVALAGEHPLGASRGPWVAATDLGRAFRLGVRLMDAEAALRLGASQDARVTIELLVGLLDDAGATGPVIFPVQQLGEGAEPSDRDRADQDLEGWLAGEGPGHVARYRFGKGSEAVRFALVAGEVDLVRESVRRGYLDVDTAAELAPATMDSLEVLKGLVRAGDATALDAERLRSLLMNVMLDAAR